MPGGVRGFAVSLCGLTKDLRLKRQVGLRTSQPGVLRLKLLQPLHVVAFQATVLVPPPVVVTSITPIARIASASALPWPHRTSTCRSFATVSSAVCALLAVEILLGKTIPQDGPLQWGAPHAL